MRFKFIILDKEGEDCVVRIPYSNIGNTKFQRLLGHNEEILKYWSKLEDAFYEHGNLSAELKEQVRRTLAFGNDCKYCQAKGKPEQNIEDSRVSLAIAFADLFLKSRDSINQGTFDMLRREFTNAEIAELCSYICFTTGNQMFGALMDLEP